MNEKAFRSPFAALVWKEWRESWWLLILTFVWPAASYSTASYCTGVKSAWDGLAVVGILLLALFLGSGLFAGERAQGTSGFLAERALGRNTIWNAKVLMPLLTLAAALILYGIVSCLLLPTPGYAARGLDIFMTLAAAFLMFASALLCSVLLDRPVTAWAAGGVLSFALFVGQGALIEHFMGLDSGRLNEQWALFLSLLVLEAIGLLWLSRVAYVRWMHD